MAFTTNIQDKIESIRQKPVSSMTGKELAFIYKHGDITPEEKKALKKHIAAKKAKSVEQSASAKRDLRSSELDNIENMMSKRHAPRYTLEPQTADEIGSIPEDDDDSMSADSLFSSPVPADTPSAREISESGAVVVSKPKKSTFKKLRQAAVKVIHEPVVVIAVVILLIMLLFIRAFFVPSGSMRPTLMEGDRIVSIAQYFPSGSTYQRGDIACFTAPNGTVYVKRVIGIGGDHIQISGEKVYVNGEESPYQGTGGVMTSMDVQLADDEYWVMGDNRGNSEDSLFIGPVKADKMISKVIAIYMPSEHATFL